MSSYPTTKAQLLMKMDTGYTEFEGQLASLSDSELTTAGVNGDWSIKDILFHLATWHGRAAQSLEAALLNEEPKLSPPVNNDEEMNRFNDENFALGRSRSLAEVWQDFHTSYQLLHQQVDALSEEDLLTLGRFSWMEEGAPLGAKVVGNTYGHYEKHQPEITVWLARQKG